MNKNKLILIAGAILIVLSAVVFLLSTWNTTPDMIKLAVMILLTFVFLGLSYVSDKKLKLEQTSKTFYYLAMAYIPIVLFAISAFGFLGEYLSLTGAGKYVYFTIGSVFLTGLYFEESIRKSARPLSVTSIVFQVLFVIFFVKIFSSDFYHILLGIQIYLFILSCIIKFVGMKYYEDMYQKFVRYTFNTLIVITFLSLIFKWIFASATVFNILSCLLLILNYYVLKEKTEDNRTFFNINVLMTVLTIISLKSFHIGFDMKLLIMSMVVVILYAINYVVYKKLSYKVIAYIAFNFTLLAVLQLMNATQYVKYILPVTTMIEIIIEKISAKDELRNFIILSFILSFITLNIDMTLASFLVLVFLGIAYMIYIRVYDREEVGMLDIVPMLAVIPSIFFYDLFEKIHIVFALNTILAWVCLILVTVRSLLKRQMSTSTLMSVIYFVLMVWKFELNIYLSATIALIWSVIHAICFEEKNPFKVIAYLSGLVIYQNLISDIGLEITLANILGYLICTYLITRTVIKTSGGDYKTIEYIVGAILYWYALSLYTGITDAMIFITFLVIASIFGYLRKFGPLFLTSLIAIVVNMLKLTKDFWYSVPWWVYLLSVGVILLTFAIRNEMNEEGKKGSIKEAFQKLKDRIDI